MCPATYALGFAGARVEEAPLTIENRNLLNLFNAGLSSHL
jgi:hypothetical protein